MADSEWAGGNKAGKESGKKESRRDVVIRNIYEVVPVFWSLFGEDGRRLHFVGNGRVVKKNS